MRGPKQEIFGFLCSLVLFLYFLTVSAELLHVPIYLFKPKLNHVFALLLLGVTLVSVRVYHFPKKILYALSLLFLAQTISAFCSPCWSRCFGYIVVNAITVVLFFVLPIHCFQLFDRRHILKLYFGSFVCVGLHAASQFVLSFFGMDDPFVRQKLFGFIARGQSLTYEPSYYALYAIGPVMYYNTKKLLERKGGWLRLLCVNFLLIASTSTGAFFGYFFFIGAFLVWTQTRWIKPFVQGLWRQTVKIGVLCGSLFLGMALSFPDLFLLTFYKFFYVGFFLHISFLERWEALLNSWQIFCAHPCFGVGLGGIGPIVYLRDHFLYEKTALVNPSIELLALSDPKNVLFELLGSLGVFGLVAFGVFGGVVYSVFRKALREMLEWEHRVEVFALFVSLLVVLFCLQFNQGLFRNYVWLHMGLGVGYVLSLIPSPSRDFIPSFEAIG